MNEPVATFAQWAAMLILWGSFALGLIDFGKFTKEERRAGVRPGIIWGVTAVALVLLIGVLRGVAFGWGRFWGFLIHDGQFLFWPAAGLVLIVQSGQGWAGICGGKPFPPARRPWRKWPWRDLCLSLAAMIVWTLLIAWLVPQRGSADLLRRLGLEGMDPRLQIPTAMALLTLAPIIEECLFRHFLLYRVAGWLSKESDATRWMPNAIVITSLLWSVGHLGQIEPLWVKWLQVFVPGLILGWMAWKHGLERAIALHWGFNLCLLGLVLIRN